MDRPSLLRRALALSVISIVFSGALGGIAVVVGLATDSVSLLGFGLDSAIDSIASIVLVWRFRAEVREPHRAERIERIAERAVGAVLIGVAIYLALSAINALVNGVRAILLLIAVVALPPLALAKYRTARDLGSGALRADSILTGIAALLALIGLVSLVLDEAADIPWADAVGALVIAVIVAREGWASVRAARTHQPLLTG
jgi:divalent metal cation (Fe/Co/Zn/Cd) transporter